MNFFDSLNLSSLHHAYLIVGQSQGVVPDLLNFFETKIGFRTHGNPDFWIRDHETFTVDDARSLSDFHLRKPVSSERKIFVLSIGGITVEAQNALLKLFEEPIPGNHFFLIVPETNTILPTLLSRVFVLAPKPLDTDTTLGKKFLGATLGERLKLIGAMVEAKDKEGARDLLRSLISELRDKPISLDGDRAMILKDILKADDYLSDRAPSIKILLEHIAQVLPRR